MADRPLVAVVTILYRARERLTGFIDRLRRLTYSPILPLFVVNDASEDEIAALRRALPDAIIVRPGRNVGTAAAWNLGLEKAVGLDARYVWFWNIDVDPAPNCLELLVDLLNSSASIGACEPLLLHSDQRQVVQMYGGSVDLRSGMTWHDCNGVTLLDSLSPLRDVGYLDGGSMLVKRSVLQQVSGFDESFFLYYEDVDVSLRIRKAGLRTVALRDARAWHEHRSVYGKHGLPYQTFYKTRNRLYMVGKHAGRNHKRRLAAALIAKLPLTSVYLLSQRQICLVRPYVAGVIAGLRGDMGYLGWVP